MDHIGIDLGGREGFRPRRHDALLRSVTPAEGPTAVPVAPSEAVARVIANNMRNARAR